MSSSNYGDGSGLTMLMKFEFRVPAIMRAGRWRAVVTAFDEQGQQSPPWGPGSDMPVDVYYYGAVETQCASVDLPEPG